MILSLPTGETLSYDEYGAGPVIALVHGSPGTSKAWQRVGERLAGRFRVVVPTLPGAPSDADNSALAAPIEALLAHTGPPAVLAGHSHGGVVALNVALRGRVAVGALALFEPVAVSILRTVDDGKAYEDMKAVFDGYIGGHEAGDRDAVRIMVDYWFGPGAFARMPGAMQEYLRDNAAHNVRDVRATFRDRYSAEAMRRLTMPVVLAVGARSPEVTFKIARALSSLAPHGSLVTLDGADHALATTHTDAVTDLIDRLAGPS